MHVRKSIESKQILAYKGILLQNLFWWENHVFYTTGCSIWIWDISYLNCGEAKNIRVLSKVPFFIKHAYIYFFHKFFWFGVDDFSPKIVEGGMTNLKIDWLFSQIWHQKTKCTPEIKKRSVFFSMMIIKIFGNKLVKWLTLKTIYVSHFAASLWDSQKWY